MDLHALVAPIIGIVNPQVPLRILISNGYAVDAAGKQTPLYLPPLDVVGQVQSLTFRDVQMLAGINIEGVARAIYISGRVDAFIRPDKKGSDTITIMGGVDVGTVWSVVHMLEYWPEWCKAAVTRQNL